MVAVIAAGIFVAPFDWDVGGIERNPVAVDAIPDIGENQQIVFTEWMDEAHRMLKIRLPIADSALLGIPASQNDSELLILWLFVDLRHL